MIHFSLFGHVDLFAGEGLVQMSTPNGLCTLRIRAVPLPGEVTRLLETNEDSIKTLHRFTVAKIGDKSETGSVGVMTDETKKTLLEFKAKLKELLDASGSEWSESVDRIWSFGPRKVGPNMLLNRLEDYNRPSVWTCLESGKSGHVADCDNSIVNGFQMATLAGPLCEEPLRGVCYVVEFWEMPKRSSKRKPVQSNPFSALQSTKDDLGDTRNGTTDCDVESAPASTQDDMSTQLDAQCRISQRSDIGIETIDVSQLGPDASHESILSLSPPQSPASPLSDGPLSGGVGYGQLTGQLMTLMLKACRKSFSAQPQRLVVAMYTCVIQATADVLGA